MEDEAGEDPKILSVPVKDPRFVGYQTLSDVHPHLLKEVKEFFETYKRLEPRKWVKFKAWEDVGEAMTIITYAMNLFKEKFT